MTAAKAILPRALRPLMFWRPAVFVVYFSLLAAGKFDTLPALPVLPIAFTGLLCGLIIFEIVLLASSAGADEVRWFRLGLWILVAVRIAIQATGGLDSFLYPLAYLIFAVLAGVLSPGYSVGLGLAFLGLEASWLMLAGKVPGGWRPVAEHGLYLAGFGVAVGLLARLERKGRQEAQRALRRMEDKVSEFQKDDTVHRLSALSEGGRERETLRSVFALDEAFYAALEAARKLLAAESCALYWRSDEKGPLRLREISSSEEGINTQNEIVPGQGLLGFAAEKAAPVRASGAEPILKSIPYYNSDRPRDHLLAAPVGEPPRVQGLLIADRQGERPFAETEEKLLTAVGRQLLELHEHAVLLRRTEGEAAQFKSLAELSHRLSRTLDLEAILDAVIRTSQAMAGHDAAAVVLPGDAPGELVLMRAGGELAAKLQGETVRNPGTLAGWAVSEKQYLVIPDLPTRTQKTPVLGARLDPHGMRSVLIHPLPLRHEARGALAFFARAPDAFSRYVVQATGILADLAAVSIHNALLYREMEKRAVSDGLTGLFNHRWFQERLAEEIERAARLGTRLALLLVDIDHFKRVNDSYGHPVGDEVLKAVAGALRGAARKVDSAARYGGEEFVMILVGTAEAGALEFAERLRKKVQKLLFHADGKEFRVSISIGLAVYPEDAKQKQTLLELADQALYQAKESGRNRTVSASKRQESS